MTSAPELNFPIHQEIPGMQGIRLLATEADSHSLLCLGVPVGDGLKQSIPALPGAHLKLGKREAQDIFRRFIVPEGGKPRFGFQEKNDGRFSRFFPLIADFPDVDGLLRGTAPHPHDAPEKQKKGHLSKVPIAGTAFFPTPCLILPVFILPSP